MAVGALTAAALLGAGIQGVQGLGAGIGRAVGARQYFTREDRERLEELRRMEAMGQLGLSDAERSDIEAAFTAQRGAGARAQESAGLQRAVAAGQAQDARALFLNELAQQQAEQQARAVQAGEMVAAERAAVQAQENEMRQLDAQRRQRRQEMAAGIAEAATGGIVAGGAAAMPAIEQSVQKRRQQQILDQARATARTVTEEEAALQALLLGV